jgi:cytochrome c biogenesis protein CcmG, thiol:disulfide interchange protein DsbE
MVIAVYGPTEFAHCPQIVLRYNRVMRLKPILFFAVVGVIAGYIIYKQADPNVIAAGKPAPDFTVKDQNGNQLKLSELRGNLVFLNVWATDCAPCVQEMPDMEVMNHAFKDRKFKMVTVSIDTDWKPVTAFFKQYRLTMPVYLDPGRSVYGAYHLTGTPETFLIDRNGIILKHTIGADRWASDAVLAYVDKLIKVQEMPQRASE